MENATPESADPSIIITEPTESEEVVIIMTTPNSDIAPAAESLEISKDVTVQAPEQPAYSGDLESYSEDEDEEEDSEDEEPPKMRIRRILAPFRRREVSRKLSPRHKELKARWAVQRAEQLAARPKYDWCAFCGKNDNLKHHKDVPDSYDFYAFCKTGGCFKKFGVYKYSDHVDMTQGVPVCYAKVDPKSAHKDVKASKKNKGQDLFCDYCGTQNAKVITNVAMDKRYHHVNFCMNNSCCRLYIEYVQSVKRVPYALSIVPEPLPVKRKKLSKQRALF
jgi:hypothetical protein